MTAVKGLSCTRLALGLTLSALVWLPVAAEAQPARDAAVTFPGQTFDVGTLPAHASITIEFEVVVENPLNAAASQVCNQGTISGENPLDSSPFSVDTDDPAAAGTANETCTGLTPLDFGDAPAPFPTLVADDGARHELGGPLLGACVDSEADGQAAPASDGDDTGAGTTTTGTCAVAGDDEDGVVLGAIVPGGTGTATVTVAGAPGLLDAWIDFNGNGSWGDAGEQIFDDLAVAVGVSNPTYAVPAGATAGLTTRARFRLSTAGVASFTGAAPDGEVEDDQVTIANPAISVTKTALPTSVPEPGGNVAFTVRVDNTGDVPVDLTALADDVYGNITQVQGDIVSTDCSVPQTIAALGFYGCTFTAAYSCDGGDSQTDTVTATAVANGTGGNTLMATGDATVTCTDAAPSLTATKTASPMSVAEPGAPVSFTVEIENTSAASDPVTLTSLTDDVYGDVTMVQGDITATDCALVTINPGDTTSCTFTALVSCNAAASPATDTVTAAGTDDEGTAASAMASASVTCTDVLPSITVSKAASPTSITEPGGVVDFTVEVTNTSVAGDPVTLTSLTDDVYGDVTMVQGDVTATDCALVTINPGDTTSCTFTAQVSCNAADGSAGDTVTAAGTDDEGNPVSGMASASVTCTDAAPSITVSKTPTPATVVEPGGPVDFTVEVTNLSVASDPVTLDTLSDDVYGDITTVQGDITATDCALTTVGPGDTYSCTFTAGVSGTAGDEITDTVTASGEDDEMTPVAGEASATVGVTGTDFGDAEDPAYPTLLASGGARHTIPPGVTLFLGAAIDHEADGQSTADADGDDTDGSDDEDGVELTSIPVPGGTGDVEVTASAAGLLDAWIDFDGNGSWADAGEQVFTGEPLSAGVNNLVYAVPAGALPNPLVARFRVSSAGGLSFDGAAADGEVEDHLVVTDSEPPTVTALDTVPATGGGLDECEAVRARLRDVVVTFSEPVLGLEDPANYRLARPGANGVFDTFDCAGSGDDELEAADSVGDANPVATVRFGAVPDGRYKLVVCDTITDLAGNPLDGGAGDLDPGGSFERTLRVDAGNRFVGGHFDCVLGGWDKLPPGAPEIGRSGEDVEDSGESGSAGLSGVGMAGLGIEQCAPVAPASPFEANPYLLAGRFRLDAAADVEAGLGRLCESFASPDCSGPPLGTFTPADQILADTGGTWLAIDSEIEIPAAALSARCSFSFLSLETPSPDAFLDALRLTGEGLIFTDGFESGNVSVWSSATGN